MESSSRPSPESQPFLLAGATVEPLRNLIRRDGQQFQVERQVMLLLLFLVENADQVVTRETLIANLWDTSFPKDEALTQAISKLRKALGDTPQRGRIIQTIRKVGYRLIGPVSYAAEPTPGPAKESERPRLRRSRLRQAVAIGIAVILFAIASLLNIVTVRTIKPGDIPSDTDPAHRATMVRMVISENLAD